MTGIPKISMLTKAFALKNQNNRAYFQGRESNKQQPNENSNLKFKVEHIEFYPEDVEKMRDMLLEERIAYRRQLKRENKYIITDNERQ